MPSIIQAADCRKQDDGFSEYLLANLRCCRLRVQLLQVEIDEIGVALKNDLITPEAAAAWMFDLAAQPWCTVIRPEGLKQVGAA